MAQRVAGRRANRYNQHRAYQEQQGPQRRLQDRAGLGQGRPEEEQQMSNRAEERLERDQVAVAGAGVTPSSSLVSPESGHSASNRGKFIKSKSSPSSLTTHKFGLRPTPSPPRLIIDHKTGDIVERYPENPILLRTYQPIDEAASREAFVSEDDDDATQNQIEDSLASNPSQRQHRKQPEGQQQAPNQEPARVLREWEGAREMGDYMRHGQLNSPASGPNKQHQARAQPAGHVIPPPHSGKVYFAPPATSNSLFEAPAQRPRLQRTPAASKGPSPLAPPADPSLGRALSSLSDSERTDIAILTEPDDSYESRMAPQMKITATSASKASALLAQQQPRPQVISANASKLYGQPAHSRSPSVVGGERWKSAAAAQQQQQQPQKQQRGAAAKGAPTTMAVEKSDLYDFCFNLRIFVVLLVSAAIIYLLVWPLGANCSRFRPALTHVSITTASVNLIFVLAFTLFWYCTSVSRTLYQNLSSSAFIVTIYSILVCLNLTLAIIFFFINSCHFQKLLATPSVSANMAPQRPGAADGPGSLPGLLMVEPATRRRRQPQGPGDEQRRLALDQIIESIERQLDESDKRRLRPDAEHSRRARRQADDSTGLDDATVLDDRLGPPVPPKPTTTTTSPAGPAAGDFFNQDHASGYTELPELSPIEAAWRYLREQARLFRGHFFRFLHHYDLKFIGALHAICAACFQYLAIKVAVVRSFYCSPTNTYA